MLRNNADARQCSYFELGLPVNKLAWDEQSFSSGKARAVFRSKD